MPLMVGLVLVLLLFHNSSSDGFVIVRTTTTSTTTNNKIIVGFQPSSSSSSSPRFLLRTSPRKNSRVNSSSLLSSPSSSSPSSSSFSSTTIPITVDSLSQSLERYISCSKDPETTRLALLNIRFLEQQKRSNSYNNDNDDDDGGAVMVINGPKIGQSVTVKSSTIPNAGNGLFATDTISKGDLITCYPGDAIIDISTTSDSTKNGSTPTKSKSSTFKPSKSWKIISWGDHVTTKKNEQHQKPLSITSIDQLEKNLFGYMLTVDDDYGILALPDLYKSNDGNNNSDNNKQAYLGHFANDGAAIQNHNDNNNIEEKDISINDYIKKTYEKCNAKHISIGDGSHMVTVATRSIVSGEEIFVTYGTEYWLETIKYQQQNMIEKVGLSIGILFVLMGIILSQLI